MERSRCAAVPMLLSAALFGFVSAYSAPDTYNEKCGKSHWCFYANENLESCTMPHCDLLFTAEWQHAKLPLKQPKVELRFYGKSRGWMAMGISNDRKMPNTTAVVCRASGDSEESAVHVIYNYGYEQPQLTNAERDEHFNESINFPFPLRGGIHCSMSVPVNPRDYHSPTWIDLSEERFLIFAYGEMVSPYGAVMKKHSTKPYVMQSKLNLKNAPQSWNLGTSVATTSGGTGPRALGHFTSSIVFLLVVALPFIISKLY